MLSQISCRSPLFAEVHWLHSGDTMTSVPAQAMLKVGYHQICELFWVSLLCIRCRHTSSYFYSVSPSIEKYFCASFMPFFTKFKLTSVSSPLDVLWQSDSLRIFWTHLNWQNKFIKVQWFASRRHGISDSLYGTSRLCSGSCQNGAQVLEKWSPLICSWAWQACRLNLNSVYISWRALKEQHNHLHIHCLSAFTTLWTPRSWIKQNKIWKQVLFPIITCLITWLL